MRVTPSRFRLIAAAAVGALVLTIVSGAAVRLTGSGLGCPDWPSCTGTSVVAPLHFHAWIEFGNRLINAIVTVASIGALLAAWFRSPRRRDLTLLSAGLVVGLVVEVAMGALVVYYKLAPGLVMAHFLIGMLFLGVAVLLHHRSTVPDAAVQNRTPVVDHPQVVLGRLLVAVTAITVMLGSVVTSTGPHGGSPSTPRFGFSLHSVAQVHGTSAESLIALTLLSLWVLVRSGAPRPVLRRAEVFLAVLLLQGAIGYSQYFSGDPATLVGFHVAGAALLAVAVLRYYLGLFTYTASQSPPRRNPQATGAPAVAAPSPPEESLCPLPRP